MPRRSEKIKIEGGKYDRRQKLTEEQRKEIRLLYKIEGLSTRKLANRFGVSRRLISFVLDEEKYKIAKEQFKERRKDGRYAPTKEERNKIMREYRNYKEFLFKNELIK